MSFQFESTKIIDLGSCAFRQWRADSHCKFIHGYRLQAKFWFGCNNLDEKNWVVDFGGLKQLKLTLEKQFDHTLCIAGDDPLLEDFKNLHNKGAVDLRIMPTGVGIERTAQWCFINADIIIRSQTNNRCWVERVEVWEHDKNSAIVTRDYVTVPQHDPYVSEKHNAEQFELPFQPQATTVAAPAPEIQNAVTRSNAAAVGNEMSTGWGNPFGGTSWGS